MMLYKFERRKIQFIKRIESIANAINQEILKNKYHVEVFFSGRDEDFIIINFKRVNLLYEFTIELTNHQYILNGSEFIHFKLFKIDGDKLLEIINISISIGGDTNDINEPVINSIINKLCTELQNLKFKSLD